jgi:hypothetical protein
MGDYLAARWKQHYYKRGKEIRSFVTASRD